MNLKLLVATSTFAFSLISLQAKNTKPNIVVILADHRTWSDAPISLGNNNLASTLQNNRYKTSAIGKWHSGLGNNDLDYNYQINLRKTIL